MASQPDSVVVWLRANHGVISRAQAVSLGMAPGQVRRLVATGGWHVLHRGVYSPAPCSPTPHRDLLAAVLAGGAGAVASHRSAGWLHGLLDGPPSQPSITVPYPRCADVKGARVTRSRDVPSRVVITGISTTAAWATLRDLATVAGPAELTMLVDRALAHRLVQVGPLARRLQADRKHPGSRLLLDHVARRGLGVGEAPTVAESLMQRLLVEAGLPPPARQWKVVAEGRTFYLDAAYPDRLLCFESDGHEFHSSPEAISADHDRRAALRSVGWDVVVFTYRDLRADRRRVIARMQRSWAAHDTAPMGGSAPPTMAPPPSGRR
ncbi:MAG TPA: type IV toxin-antitoxin system AbiEi family antitoxin domain-containing protein [Acidimicrobiales bacterium]|nr:type IV toxin-antitoxin system AbiEi family antitoxin domain-containing protein [Acidimicrobiales bacterium]